MHASRAPDFLAATNSRTIRTAAHRARDHRRNIVDKACLHDPRGLCGKRLEAGICGEVC